MYVLNKLKSDVVTSYVALLAWKHECKNEGEQGYLADWRKVGLGPAVKCRVTAENRSGPCDRHNQL